MPLPRIAVTLGDPAGVGPEVIAAAWADPRVHSWCRPVAIGQPEFLRRAVHLWQLPIEVIEVGSLDEAPPSPALLPCLQVGDDAALDAPACQVDGRSGQAAYEALVAAIQLAKVGAVDAIVTAPLNKAALWQAGHEYPGHTEILAEQCGIDDFAMMLYLAHDGASVHGDGGLGVVHVTLHMSLRDVFASLSIDAVLAKIHLADRAMRPLVSRAPRIGVAALNPHAGESGLFGDEETRIIAPAVAAARDAGIAAAGPYPADTLLVRARDGEFDAVVAMYHDQGHIALKLLGMHRAVNVTLGLPIVRTSVAHGTAFDLAWQRKADPRSMIEAIRVASVLAGRREL